MQGNGGVRNSQDSPQRRVERRPRRNSESSARDLDRPLTEEEKKAREMRRRERERRQKEGKGRSARPNRRVDLIDQLDATGIYGTGCKSPALLVPSVAANLAALSIPPRRAVRCREPTS